MVGYANNESGGYVHAASFAASATGASMIDLGGLGGTTSCALAINNKGQISGYGRAADGVNHAAIFDANGTGYNIDLNTLIAADSGWVLNSAYINDNGQICGWGTLASGETHAYLLIPPRKQVVVAATVALKPEKIRIDEVHGMWLMCTIRLPADYDVNTIDANSITLAENIESAIPIGGILKSEDAIRDFAVAAFEREAVASILHIGTLELVLSGKLADGTMFSGIASLKVEPKPVPRVKPAKKKLLKQAKKPTGKK
jgi:hypothetical protein